MLYDIPSNVLNAVADHLVRKGRRAERHWDGDQENEDVVTGGAFGELRTYRARRIRVSGGTWSWRIRADKFGSGGRASAEWKTGADGIVELEVIHEETGQTEIKALLVQAKKEWVGADSRLLVQISRMESLVPGCSAAVDYSSSGFVAVRGKVVLQAEANRRNVSADEVLTFGDFLAKKFLGCIAGARGLHYDSRSKKLRLPHVDGQPDFIVFPVRRRLKIELREKRLRTGRITMQ